MVMINNEFYALKCWKSMVSMHISFFSISLIYLFKYLFGFSSN